jgi:tetratricopeptide (TPR) repeat protein
MLGIISFYRGNTYLAKADYDEAEIYYRVALDKTRHRKGHPQYIEALNNLSLLLTRRRNPREAIELLNQANSLCTKGKPVAPVACTHVLYNLALAQLQVQDYEAALNTLESVLKAAGNLVV